MDLEDSSAKTLEPKAPRIKEVLKERKVLEKKVALSKRRRKDSRCIFTYYVLIVILVVHFQKNSFESGHRLSEKVTGHGGGRGRGMGSL